MTRFIRLTCPKPTGPPDHEINELSIRESRIVATKDSDFVDSLLLRRQPFKLLLVTTGNLRNAELEHLFLANLESIVEALATHDYVELSRSAVILHF
jgi:predicted nuclease of predicted toxin-antitoxin system